VKVWLSVYRGGRNMVGIMEANSLEHAEGLVGHLALTQRASRIVAHDETGKEYRLRRDGKFVPMALSAFVFDLPLFKPAPPARR
jgi:hypothetical protein